MLGDYGDLTKEEDQFAVVRWKQAEIKIKRKSLITCNFVCKIKSYFMYTYVSSGILKGSGKRGGGGQHIYTESG